MSTEIQPSVPARPCPVCRDPLDGGTPVTACPICETPVHSACGEYVGGCVR